MRLPLWPLLMPIWPPACLYHTYSSIYLHYYYDLVLFPFYLAIECRDTLAHVLTELKANITVCELSSSE